MKHDGVHLDEPKGSQTPEGLAMKAVRRAFFRSFGEHASRQLFSAMLVACVGVMIFRGIGWVTGGWWMFPVVACLWAVIAGLFFAWVNRLSIWEAAGLIDDRLGLESAVRSAIELRDDKGALGESSGLVAIAIERGQREAAQANLDVVFDPLAKGHWYSSAVVVGILVIVGIWMPNMSRDQQPGLTVPSAVIAKLDSIDEVLGDEAESDQMPESVSPAIQEAIDELEALKEELAQGVEDESDAQAQAAAKLEELADAIDEELDVQQSEEQAVSDRIAQAQNRHMDDEFGDMPDDGWDQIDDFAEAIKDQDYPEAQEKLQELMDRLDEMTDEQRQEISEAMDELADQIDPESNESNESESEADESDTEEQDPAEKLSESLKDQAEEIRERTEDSEERWEQGEQEGQEPEPESESQTEGEDTQEQAQGEGDESQEQRETGEPSETDSEQVTEEKQGEEGQGKEQGQGEQSLQEALEEMEDRQTQYKRQREQAQEIRERANDLIEEEESPGLGESNAEDEGEPGRSFELNEESDSEQGGPSAEKPIDDGGREDESGSGDISEYESVDASTKGQELNDLGEPIGEWYSPDENPGEISPSRASARVKRLRNASSEAQRAIEEQQVPRKYQRIVREAFERMNRRASEIEKSVESQSTIAPQGKDANSKSAQPKGDE